MVSMRNIASFLRWQLVPVRYAGKLSGVNGPSGAPVPARPLTARIEREGHAPGPTLPRETVDEIMQRYGRRGAAVSPKPGGHPFVNLLEADDLEAGNPILQFAFSPQVLDIAHDYFGGRFILDSLQLLHSWPTNDVSASQYWHLDYGDSRSLHCVAYLTDVTADAHGPFTFVDKADTRRIAASPIIRRIDDQQFAAELGPGKIRRFLGGAGESVWVDPAACYHYGSRCQVPRLALFVTFNSDRPYVAATPLVLENRQALFDAARALRPDLDESYLARLLQI